MMDDERRKILLSLKNRSFAGDPRSEFSSITTKVGDDGKTEILFGRKLEKWDNRIQLLGVLDSLNSFLGLAKANSNGDEVFRIDKIQKTLVYVMAEVACHESDLGRFFECFHSITEADISNIENEIQKIETLEKSFSEWNLNLSPIGAQLDIARTFTRQAESKTWQLVSNKSLRPVLGKFLNRLADLLWLLARVN